MNKKLIGCGITLLASIAACNLGNGTNNIEVDNLPAPKWSEDGGDAALAAPTNIADSSDEPALIDAGEPGDARSPILDAGSKLGRTYVCEQTMLNFVQAQGTKFATDCSDTSNSVTVYYNLANYSNGSIAVDAKVTTRFFDKPRDSYSGSVIRNNNNNNSISFNGNVCSGSEPEQAKNGSWSFTFDLPSETAIAVYTDTDLNNNYLQIEAPCYVGNE